MSSEVASTPSTEPRPHVTSMPYLETGKDSFKLFVKRHKNDSADAEAIVEAALWPTMRFVDSRTTDQQARAVLLRTRTQFIESRTIAVNALRAHRRESGHTAPIGVHQVKRLAGIVEAEDSGLPERSGCAAANSWCRSLRSTTQLKRLRNSRCCNGVPRAENLTKPGPSGSRRNEATRLADTARTKKTPARSGR